MFARDTPRIFLRSRTLARRNWLDGKHFDGHAGGVDAQFHGSVEEFRAVAEPLYRRAPVLHTLELTLLNGPMPEEHLLVTVHNGGAPVGAAMQTSPYPLICNGIPSGAVEIVVAELADAHPDLNGVRGFRDGAVAFSDAWRAATGRHGTVTVEERLYQLSALRPPRGVAGSARLAAGADRNVLIGWVESFFSETFGHHRDDAAGEKFVDAAEAKGDRFFVWDDNGRPVSMAMLRAPAAGVSRIGPVFTPFDRRGHGYGSAVTAAAAGSARGNGVADVVLFADLANPVSNAIYQRIGFEPVADSIRIDFVAAD